MFRSFISQFRGSALQDLEDEVGNYILEGFVRKIVRAHVHGKVQRKWIRHLIIYGIFVFWGIE